jgi:hypothetical protein
MNAIILKGAALRQPPLPQSGPRAKTIAHPCLKALLRILKSNIQRELCRSTDGQKYVAPLVYEHRFRM